MAEAPSLFKRLTLQGAIFAGHVGITAGGILGGVLAVPALIGGISYGLGGLMAGLAGAAAGAVLNYVPLSNKSKGPAPDAADMGPEAGPVPEITPPLNHIGDLSGRICAVGGGLTGVFVGAALGAGLALLVSGSETRQEQLRALTEDDTPQPPRRRKDDGPGTPSP